MVSAHHTLFEEVQNQIVGNIQSGVWKPGDVLPNELELADYYHVSQGTVRRALRELENHGVLIRRQGKGTYVASFKQNLATLRHRMNWFLPDDPKHYDPHSRLVLFESVMPPIKIARLMKCDDVEPLFHIRRELYYGEGKTVVGFDDTYLRQRDFPGLTEEVVRQALVGGSLYILYEERYGYFISRMDDTAKAVLLNPIQAEKAGVTVPWPAISLRRLSYTLEDKLIELRYIVNVTVNQHLKLRLSAD